MFKELSKKFNNNRLLVLIMAGLFLILANSANAALLNADAVLGQVDAGGTPSYTTIGPNNQSYLQGLNTPQGATAVDSINHRLFVTDEKNNRVLVFSLDAGDNLISQTPTYVLGQKNLTYNGWNLNQSGFTYPWGLAYDSINSRLFVSDYANSRVLVFDVSPAHISNGENAAYVLGQSDFISNVTATSINNFNYAADLAYDPNSSRLFVADMYNNRVMIFDVATSTIHNGEDASKVIGQLTFNAGGYLTTPNIHSLWYPRGVSYDTNNNRLFVDDYYNNRVIVFNAATSSLPTYYATSTNIIGQAGPTAKVSGQTTQKYLAGPQNSAYDPITDRLFVDDTNNNRVMVFNTATSSLPINFATGTLVIGQSSFITKNSTTTQNGLAGSVSGVSFDPISKHLFVTDTGNNRIMIFDVTTSTIANGENALDEVGHFNTDGSRIYSNGTVNNNLASKVSTIGMFNPGSGTLDTKNHRLFISDNLNYRVLVYQLDSHNKITTTTPIHVLGQPDFNTATGPNVTQNGFGTNVFNLVYDQNYDRLFISDGGGNRVLIFNVAPGSISDNMNATYVLGQTSFTTKVAGCSGVALHNPDDMAYDPKTNRLFVSDAYNHRILTFDVSPANVVNNEVAAHVLGQSNFSNNTTGVTINSLNNPTGLMYDTGADRLFVDDWYNNRIMIFNAATSTIIDGENALNVLGQTDFNSNAATSTANGLNNPDDVIGYDPATGRLLISDEHNSRVMIFNAATSTIVNGENAQSMIAQADYNQNSPSATQGTINYPNGTNTYDPLNNIFFVSDNTNNRILEFSMIKITTVSLPNGRVGDYYSQTINTTSTQGTLGFKLISGSLPSGLTFNTSTGVIFGTSTLATSTTLTIEADDNFSTGPFLDQATYNLTINPPSVPSDPSGLIINNISTSTAVLNWTDNSNNEDGFVILESTDGLVFTNTSTVAANVTSTIITGLTPSTNYYFAIATYNSGGYSNYVSSTNTSTATLPSSVPSLTPAVIVNSGTALVFPDLKIPDKGFKLIINNGEASTNNSQVKLKFEVGDDVTGMALFNFPGSIISDLVAYQNNFVWNIGTNTGTHKVCVKFFSRYGRSSDLICRSINYQPGIINKSSNAIKVTSTQVQTKCSNYTVRAGDSLSKLALKFFGQSKKYQTIIDQNFKKYPLLKKMKLQISWKLNICQPVK